LLWKAETHDKILGSANYVRGKDGVTRVLVGSYDTRLYGFDAKTGQRLWDYETANYVNGTPAVFSDAAVFGGCDAILHVVSATTGKATAQVELGGDCHVAGSVALSDGKAFFGHYGNALVCVDLSRSEGDWAYRDAKQAFFSSPAIGEDRIVIGGRDKQVHCVRRADGAPLWTFPTRRQVDGSPVICGDTVLVGSGDGRLYLLRLATGEELWNHEIGASVVSSPAVAGGRVYVGANDGRLYAFRAAAK
jgi:outer membrane protein assembly factor BamB